MILHHYGPKSLRKVSYSVLNQCDMPRHILKVKALRENAFEIFSEKRKSVAACSCLEMHMTALWIPQSECKHPKCLRIHLQSQRGRWAIVSEPLVRTIDWMDDDANQMGSEQRLCSYEWNGKQSVNGHLLECRFVWPPQAQPSHIEDLACLNPQTHPHKHKQQLCSNTSC